MKNTFLLLSVLFLTQFSFAQDNQNNENFGRNEFKINAAYLIVELFEVSYERNLNDHSSLGLSLFVPFNEEVDLRFMANPYFRIFFGKKPAQGFFVEANAALSSINSIYFDQYNYSDNGYYYVNYRERKEKEFAFGLGIAVGGKFVLQEKFVVDVYGGLGRHFGNDYLPVYPRLGINLGYRFN